MEICGDNSHSTDMLYCNKKKNLRFNKETNKYNFGHFVDSLKPFFFVVVVATVPEPENIGGTDIDVSECIVHDMKNSNAASNK